MDKGLMVLALVDEYTGGNKAKFANLLGVSAQTISAWVNRKTFDAELIYSKCIGVSPEWLLTGQGSMIKDNPEPVPASAPPLPAEASVLLELLKSKDDLIREKDETIRNQAEQIGTLKSELSHRQSTACDVPSETDAAVG